MVATLAVLSVDGCGTNDVTNLPVATPAVTETVTVTASPSPSAAAVPTATPTVDEQVTQATTLARQACQGFTDAFAKGPSSLYFPRAATLGAQAAQRDVRWATLSSDIAAAAASSAASFSSDVGRRDQVTMERSVAMPCRQLGITMIYHDESPIGQ
jgi:hypothetical protein